jgi:hypothetical protein
MEFSRWSKATSNMQMWMSKLNDIASKAIITNPRLPLPMQA